MLSQYYIVEYGDVSRRELVVRWLRSFPFSFISDREYVIARKVYHDGDGASYSITKSVRHPNVPLSKGVVRTDDFYSMWRIKDVPCPWGSDKPAVEVQLVHYE